MSHIYSALAVQELEVYLSVAIAVDNLPREQFNHAQRQARPDVDDQYLEGLWIQWKRGGILWLGVRTLQEERYEVFQAVIDYAKETEKKRMEKE